LLLGSEMGARIDGHDTVIRLNRLPTSLYEEPDVGRKTDILWIDRNLSRIELMGGASSSYCPHAGPDCTFNFSSLIVHNWEEERDCMLWSKAPYTVHTMHTHLQYEIDRFLGMFVQGVDAFSLGLVSFVAFAQLCDAMTLFGFGVLPPAEGEGKAKAVNDEWAHNLTREHDFIDRVARGALDLQPGPMRRDYGFPANSTERRLLESIQRLQGQVVRIPVKPPRPETKAATMQAILLAVLLALGAGSAILGYACRARRRDGSDSKDAGGVNSDSDESSLNAADDNAASEDGDELEVLMKRQARKSNFSMQVWIVLIFVVSSSGQAIAISAARGPDGKLPFDFAVAVFASEAMKLVIALGWLLGTGCSNLRCPPPTPWMWETADLSVVAALFTLQNELNYIVIELIGAVLFTLLSNLKIVCTAIAMKCLLGKQFSLMQWIGIVMLTLSAIVVKAPALALVSITGEDGASTFSTSQIIGIVLLQINSMSAGFAAVRNELIFKRVASPTRKMPFMLQNCVLYIWGLVLNFISWYVWGEHDFMGGVNGPAWISIICAAIFGLGVALMLRFLDNVVRCFASVGQVLFTVVVSRVLPSRYIHHRSTFDIFYVLSLVLLVSALVMYQQHESNRLNCRLFQAIVATLLLGMAVLWLEQFAHPDD